MHWTDRRKRFRALLAGQRCVHPGSVFDPISARIAEDLFRALAPRSLTIKTVYNVRGGFETTCTVTLPSPHA